MSSCVWKTLDSIYLYNKHGNPITYDQWNSIRRMINYVLGVRLYR
jgi:hypothetical protein